MNELARALKCSISDKPNTIKCLDCTYHSKEKSDDRIPIDADYYDENGVGYWIACDFKKIHEEAADLIERAY